MSSKHNRRRARLSVEELENRLLLAWTALGPAPEAGWRNGGYQPPMDISGRVSALAYSPDIYANLKIPGFPNLLQTPALFVGSASGGIWRTTDVSSNSPSWQAVSDNIKLLPGLPLGAASGLVDI